MSGTGLLEEAMESEAGQYEEKRERAEHERLLYVGMTRTAERLILTHRGAPDELPDESNYEWLAQLPVDEVLGTEFEESDRILDEYSTGLRIRHLTSDGVDMEKRPYEGGIGLEVPPVDLPSSGPRFRSPSQQEDAPVDVRVKAEPLPGDHPFEERVTTDDWDRLGLAVHTFLSGLPSLDVMDEAGRKQAAARCLRDHGVGGVVSADQLVIAGNRLLTWIDSQHSNSQWTTEVPVTALIEDSQWVGEIDVLLENRDGTYVIVDHKIKPVTEPQWEETGHEFAGQLYRYKQVIEGQGFNVSECWVHLPLGGGLVRLDFGSGS